MKILRLYYLSLLLLLGPLLSYGQCNNQITVSNGGTSIATVNNGQSGGAYSVCPAAGAQYVFDAVSTSNAILTWYSVSSTGVATVITTTTTNVTAGTVLSISVSPTVATTYRFESNATASCNGKDGFANFTFTPALTLTSSAPAGVCQGSAVTLTASGATTGSPYRLAANGSTIASQTGNTFTVSPTVTTTYTVTTTTSCGTSSQQITVPVNTLTIAPSTPTICLGESATLTATYTGNTSGITYSWFVGSSTTGTAFATGQSVSVSPNTTTVYTVQAVSTDCGTLTQQARVEVGTPAPVTVTPSASTVCSGSSVILTATSPDPNATFTWNSQPNGFVATGATVTVTPNANTTYNVTAYTGCGQTSAAATVTIVTTPTLAVAPSSPAAICAGQQLTLTASSNISNATYKWYNTANLGAILSTAATLTVAPTANTTYRVVQTASCGTLQQDVSVPVNATAAPTISVTPNNPSISYGSSVSLTASGAVGYSWSPAAGLSSTTGATVTATPTATTTYTITGSNASGCSNTAQVTVVVNRPLPVKLVSFEASWAGGSALLKWATASEVNSAYYAVERSLDGESFILIGQVAAQGTKVTATTYAYRDIVATPKAGSYYYRLRQVDLDGKEAYSPVRTVTGANTTTLSLYPNPSGTHTTLVGTVAGASVQVLDALGRVVHTATADATGAAALTLPANTPRGLYLVRAGNQTIRLTVAE